MTRPRTFRVLVIGALLTTSASMVLLTGWLLWPTWREHCIGRELSNREFRGFPFWWPSDWRAEYLERKIEQADEIVDAFGRSSSKYPRAKQRAETLDTLGNKLRSLRFLGRTDATGRAFQAVQRLEREYHAIEEDSKREELLNLLESDPNLAGRVGITKDQIRQLRDQP